jgi:hypothetical protein
VSTRYVEMEKKGSGVRGQEHGIKCKHPQYYMSLGLRCAGNGKPGTHGMSFDLRSTRISLSGQILKKTIESLICESEIAYCSVKYSNTVLHYLIRNTTCLHRGKNNAHPNPQPCPHPHECTTETVSLLEAMITGGSLGGCSTRVAKARATGESGSSANTPRVRNEPATPRQTCAGERTTRGLPISRARSLANAVIAESIRHRANSRTASASTAHDPNESDT